MSNPDKLEVSLQKLLLQVQNGHAKTEEGLAEILTGMIAAVQELSDRHDTLQEEVATIDEALSDVETELDEMDEDWNDDFDDDEDDDDEDDDFDDDDDDDEDDDDDDDDDFMTNNSFIPDHIFLDVEEPITLESLLRQPLLGDDEDDDIDIDIGFEDDEEDDDEDDVEEDDDEDDEVDSDLDMLMRCPLCDGQFTVKTWQYLNQDFFKCPHCGKRAMAQPVETENQ